MYTLLNCMYWPTGKYIFNLMSACEKEIYRNLNNCLEQIDRHEWLVYTRPVG